MSLPLLLPLEEITLQPELSSPPHFRIQGRYPERYGQRENPDVDLKEPLKTFMIFTIQIFIFT